MEKRIRRRHEAHMRVLNVCAEHSALFDATAGGQKTRAALGTRVSEISQHLVRQRQSVEDRRAAAEQCRVSRKALRTAAAMLVSVGKVVNLDTAVTSTIELPRPASDEDLLTYSRAIVERVSPHADAFVANGMPPDLLTQLGERIATFAAAHDEQAASRQRFSAASKSIEQALDEADKAVDVLQALAANTPAAVPEVLTKLRMARRIGPRVVPPESTSPQATPTDTGGVATTAANR
jgi:hypothetical protein